MPTVKTVGDSQVNLTVNYIVITLVVRFMNTINFEIDRDNCPVKVEEFVLSLSNEFKSDDEYKNTVLSRYDLHININKNGNVEIQSNIDEVQRDELAKRIQEKLGLQKYLDTTDYNLIKKRYPIKDDIPIKIEFNFE